MTFWLSHRQTKIQNRRKKTPRRQYIKEIASRKVLSFYKNGNTVSKYPQTDRIWTVIKAKEYEDHRDSLLSSTWREIYAWRSFFEQFWELFRTVELPSVVHFWVMENCDYADVVANSKDCYLSFWPINECEYVMYSDQVKSMSKRVVNSVMVRDGSEHIYMSKWIISSYNVFYSSYIHNSSNLRFCSDMIWCSECIWCSWLENVSYYINNQKFEKDVYKRKKKEILSRKDLFQERHEKLSWKGLAFWSNNVKWTHIMESEHIEDAHMTYRITNWRNLFLVWGTIEMDHIYDNICTWPWPADHMYGVVWAGNSTSHIYIWCHIASNCSNIYYSYFLQNCSYCLWCVWLKNVSFCIFNKQYSKDEWYVEVDKIFQTMEEDWTLWSFFPWWINPFYFNDTAAYLIEDDFTKQECENDWFLRRDETLSVDIPTWVKVVTTDELWQYEWWFSNGKFITEQDRIEKNLHIDLWSQWTIHPDILKVVIQDKKWNYYRVIPMEVKFLKKHGLPLPRKHRLERLKGNYRR